MRQGAIFLDKDGTLIPDIPYNVDPARIELFPDAGQALFRLQTAGYHIIVVSNQSGVARGFFSERDLKAVQVQLEELLQKWHVRLDGFYYCPHLPSGTVSSYALDCDCRKPLPGMLMQAAQEQSISLEDSWMIGDILNDVEAGNRAGCRTILINNGNETEWIPGDFRTPSFIANSLMEAADIILSKSINYTRAHVVHTHTQQAQK